MLHPLQRRQGELAGAIAGQMLGASPGHGGLAAKPFADPDAKWAANEQVAANFIRMVYNSFKRS